MHWGLRYMRWNSVVRCWWLIYALLVAGFCAATVYTLTVSQWRGPWRDMWEVMPFLEKAVQGTASWSDYWEQYGFSHRPMISRWLWAADLRWFSGSNHLLLTVSLFMQLLIFCNVRWVLRGDASYSSQQRKVVLVGVFFCLLNITQVFNFLHTFDVQWFLVTGFVTLALGFVLRHQQVSNTSLIAAWLLIFFASLNNFSGLIMWPVVTLLIMGLRMSWRRVLIFFLAFVIYLPLYFYQLTGEGGSDSHSILSQMSGAQWAPFLWLTLIKFPLWYLSNPLSFQLSVEGPLHTPAWVSWIAPSLVLILVIAAAKSWYCSLLRGIKRSAVAWLGLSLMLFAYGVGVATAIGRTFFWDNVYALRYQNIVLLFWIGVVLWLSSSVRWRNTGLATGALLLLLIFVPQIGWYHDLMLKTGNRTRDAHLALVVGLENQLSAIQSTVSRSHLGKDSQYTLQHEAAALRNWHAGPYADPSWSDIPSLAKLDGSPLCQTSVIESDVHGSDERYARLLLRFREAVSYTLIVWYNNDASSFGLLIPAAADTWWQRLQQSFGGFSEYAGFAKQMPKQKSQAVFARADQQWCRLTFL